MTLLRPSEELIKIIKIPRELVAQAGFRKPLKAAGGVPVCISALFGAGASSSLVPSSSATAVASGMGGQATTGVDNYEVGAAGVVAATETAVYESGSDEEAEGEAIGTSGRRRAAVDATTTATFHGGKGEAEVTFAGRVGGGAARRVPDVTAGWPSQLFGGADAGLKGGPAGRRDASFSSTGSDETVLAVEASSAATSRREMGRSSLDAKLVRGGSNMAVGVGSRSV
ncbi:hypothetical protein HK405_015459 [Cladochytrium tenue]|nr:hypothetical protein HK405_015459 [Cladochytrium tenue]